MKTKVYKKLFVMYSTVIVAAVLTLTAFFINSTFNDMKRQQTYVDKKLLTDTNDFLNSRINTVKVFMSNLYSSTETINDTIFYLQNDYEDYTKFKLDNLLKSQNMSYRSLPMFIKSCYAYDDKVSSMSVYSLEKKEVSIFDSAASIDSSDLTLSNDKNGAENLADKVIDKIKKMSNKKEFFIVNNIMNPYDLQKLGVFVVGYSVDDIGDIYKNYVHDNTNLVAMDKNGNVLYDSTNKYTGKEYPYFNRIKSDGTSFKINSVTYADYIVNSSGIVILSSFSQGLIYKQIIVQIVVALLLAALIVAVSESIVYIKIKEIETRMLNIIYAMDDVKKGKFDTPIPVGRENDEINLISENFNDMCVTLDRFIKQEYLQKIKQKNAEMKALQNQINPHFLYNTIESIRMKAIADGNRDVGKMLFNLASIFRNVVKGKDIITIRQELEFCKRYLDLYKFRYNDKFNYSIDYDDEVLNKQISKLIVQPVVENFLVHGIDLERDDNFLTINAEPDKEDITITVEDNGKGISQEEIIKINEGFKSNSSSDSVGLKNVSDRIKLTYGDEYGIRIEKAQSRGIKVVIRIPNREDDENA